MLAKITPQALACDMVRTPDILHTLAPERRHCLTVGFAAETQDILTYARQKLTHKDLDMCVANDVSQQDTGFASDTNAGWLLSRDGAEVPLPHQSKDALAHVILRHVMGAIPKK